MARLDLLWDNNAVLAPNVNVAGAYYENDDAFKSRDDDATPAGPFQDNGRRRNAQRQAARIANFIDPGAGTFLYSGMGASTFRLDSSGDTGIFSLDNDPYLTTGDANNAVNHPGSNPTQGELGFGWGQY